MTTTAVQAPLAHALVVAAEGEGPELTGLLRGLGFQPFEAETLEGAASFGSPISLCLIDLRRNGEALRIARLVRTRHPEATVIGIVDPARPSAAADAIRAGMFDVLPRPPSARDLEALLSNARELGVLAKSGSAGRPAEPSSYGIVGSSPAMRPVMELVQRAADGRCGILICGERGTGREMIARAIHAHGKNRATPFIKVDCAAASLADVETHLFGRVAAISNGSGPDRRGLERLSADSLLMEVSGGILFLESITELPARVQARLVRVLRDREVFVDDESEPVSVDIRPIAAVDGSIEAVVEEGGVRQDLLERLSLIRIDVPALRQRREDIPVLATHFLKELCRSSGTPMKTLTRSALTLLSALPWRGNAPELRGLLERLLMLVPQGLIRLEDVLAHTQLDGSISPTGVDATLRQARNRFERDYISAVLQHQHGRIAEAARVLGIQRTNLYRKMRRLNLMRAKASGREA